VPLEFEKSWNEQGEAAEEQQRAAAAVDVAHAEAVAPEEPSGLDAASLVDPWRRVLQAMRTL
jgi:hypothetical protein